MADVFKALSNPNRLKVFMRLVACCPAGTLRSMSEVESCSCVGDLGKDLAIGPSTLSHHLKELQRSGLVRCRRQGQRVECFVDPEVLKEMAAFFKG
jgi:ArsR family transcriptional regulator, arsenate/arsenite/antimonite-responsive transcriptional repressor